VHDLAAPGGVGQAVSRAAEVDSQDVTEQSVRSVPVLSGPAPTRLFVLWVIDSLGTRLNHVPGKNISTGLADSILRLASRHERAQPK
jgi:hypothetical protein